MSESMLEMVAEILECSATELDVTTRFRDHTHWDSLAALSTIATVDSEYGVTLSQVDFEQLQTIGELEAYIQEQGSA